MRLWVTIRPWLDAGYLIYGDLDWAAWRSRFGPAHKISPAQPFRVGARPARRFTRAGR